MFTGHYGNTALKDCVVRATSRVQLNDQLEDSIIEAIPNFIGFSDVSGVTSIGIN